MTPAAVARLQRGRAAAATSRRHDCIADAKRARNCRCQLRVGMTDEQLIALGAGCQTDYVCPTLDALRRILGVWSRH